MRVAAIQHDTVWEDRDANFAHLAPMIGAAAAGGARLVVLTEMFSTGFSNNIATVAEPEGGPSSQFLVEMARTHGAWVTGSCPELPVGSDAGSTEGRPFNSHVIANPDGTVHRYRKIHPFTYAGEDRFYAAGEELVTIDIDGIRVSPFVCYDLRFADEFWQLAANTDLYIVPANWPESRRLHWQSLLLARAIENQAYVIGTNRVGTANGLAYSGDSRIIDPLGELLATAAKTESILTADISAEYVAEVRDRFRFMADRRPSDIWQPTAGAVTSGA
jgi:predicted amidohydrolase